MEPTSKHLEAIDRTTAVVSDLADGIQELKADVVYMTDTLNRHTPELNAISKDVRKWNTEIVARVDRHDQWVKQIADSSLLQLQ